jgi:pyruvate formate lyase activating enzyme
MRRRDFICGSAGCAAWLLTRAAGLHPFWSAQAADAAVHEQGQDMVGSIFRGDAPAQPGQWSCAARHTQPLELSGRVVCGLCPHRCVLSPGDRGVCRSRVNIEGRIYSLVYGNPCAVHLDPIEKKPLFHFRPASRAFSIATTGCNLRCLNCQNWEISQAKPHEVRHESLMPPQVVAAAREAGAQALAYTYSEPVTFYEYTSDTARLARAAGMDNLLISAGYINSAPLAELAPLIDAANINLKSFSDTIYRRLNGARLEPVLETFRQLHRSGLHLEITNLVVPGYTDDAAMVRRMCAWILDHLGPDHPLHFSRFMPKYRLDRLPPTPVAVLEEFRAIAMETGIRYVYIGNVPGHDGLHTYCHACRRRLVERQGYRVAELHIDAGCCRFCGTRIPGVWQRRSTSAGQG